MGRGAHHGNPPLLPALPPAADTRALAALAAGGPLLDWSHAASKLSVLLGGEPPVEEAAPPPTDPILVAVAAAKRKSKFRPTDPNSRAHPGTRDVLRVFSFADIYRWGGTASLFSLVVWDTTRDTEVELQLWTREGPTIAGLVVEYINTIMEDRATPALPKRSLGTSASD